jgi:hypothetical protein
VEVRKRALKVVIKRVRVWCWWEAEVVGRLEVERMGSFEDVSEGWMKGWEGEEGRERYQKTSWAGGLRCSWLGDIAA